MTSQFKPSTAPPTGGQHPILLMDAVMDSYVTESTVYEAGTPNERTAMSIKFKFKDVDVIEALEPYPFPITEVTLPYRDPSKDRGGTRWAVWTGSGRQLLGGAFDLDALVGKKQRWGQINGMLREALLDEDGNPDMEVNSEGEPILDRNGRARQKWGDVPRLCWQIISVEGQTSAASNGAGGAEDFFDYLASKAEGNDEAKFHQVLISDQKVTSHQDVVEQITNRQLVPNLIALGKLTRDEQGVLHRA